MVKIRLCLVGLFCLFAAACASDGQPKIDETLSSDQVQTGITLACSVYVGIKAGYDAYATDHPVKEKTTQAIALASAGITEICTPPYPTSTNELIAKVTKAGVAVYNALLDEKKAPEPEAP